MGMMKKTCCLTPVGSSVRLPNPNPLRFTIVRALQVGSSVVAEVRYPDCLNFEGKKVMVYENMSKEAFCARKHLDPHFALSGGPVARFEPTERGWGMAVLFASITNGGDMK
jgi:hypothetical protein